MKRASIYFFLIAIVVVVYSCRKDYRIIGPIPDNTPVSIISFIPPGFPSLASDLNIRKDNPLTEEGIALGRRLFYDEALR